MAAEDGLKAQKLLAQGVWMQNTLFFQGVLDVTYDTPPLLFTGSSFPFIIDMAKDSYAIIQLLPS